MTTSKWQFTSSRNDIITLYNVYLLIVFCLSKRVRLFPEFISLAPIEKLLIEPQTTFVLLLIDQMVLFVSFNNICIFMIRSVQAYAIISRIYFTSIDVHFYNDYTILFMITIVLFSW